jgi:hypothetical protein
MMRPDEQASEAAIERDQRFRSNVGKGVKAAVNIGTSVAGAGIAAKVMPWLSEYIPADLAMKGLSKVAPKVANFLKRGHSMGLDIKEGMDYVKDQFSSRNGKESPENAENPQESPKNTQNSKNIIEQYSPELHQFIDQEVKKGRSVIQAGALAQNDKRFGDIIKKLTKDHKADWSSILETIYGGSQSPNATQQAQPPQQQQQAQQQQVYYDYDRGSQQPQGQGQQALMQILAKINQKLGQ